MVAGNPHTWRGVLRWAGIGFVYRGQGRARLIFFYSLLCALKTFEQHLRIPILHLIAARLPHHCYLLTHRLGSFHNWQAHDWHPCAYTVEVTVAKVMATAVSVLGCVTVVAYVVAPGVVMVRVDVVK